MAGMVFGGRGGAPRLPLKPGQAHGLLMLSVADTLIEGPEEVTPVTTPHAHRVLPGVRELLLHYRMSGWIIAMLTNQPNLGLQTVQHAVVQHWHGVMVNKLGNTIDFAVYCPHSPDAPDELFRICSCRKPKYGLTVMAHAMAEQIFEVAFPHSMQLVVGKEREKKMAEDAGLYFQEASEWRTQVLSMKLIPFPASAPVLEN